MTSLYKVLYHVTSAQNYVKIVQSGGINPQFARGRIKRCYYCEKSEVSWAIMHCVRRHDWQLKDIVVLKIKARAGDFLKVIGWPFYATQIVYLPYDVEGAEHFSARLARLIETAELIENGNFWEHLIEHEPPTPARKKRL